jgi:hypothetical protein
MNRQLLGVGLIALGACAVAGALANKIVVNGKAVPGEVLVRNGETYIPVSALKAGGIKVTSANGTISIWTKEEAGQFQTDALEGGMNEWLNNGAFRMRVAKVEPYTDLNGARHCVRVTMELRNVSNTDMIISDAGTQGALTLYDDKGNTPETDGAEWNNNFLFKTLAPAAGTTAEVNFYYPVTMDPSTIGVPDRLLVQVKPDPALLKARGLRITVPKPSMRFLLQKKSG